MLPLDGVGMASSTPSVRGQFASFRPPACLLNLSGEYQSDEDGDFQFFRARNRLDFDTSSEADSESAFSVPDTVCAKEFVTFVYIDDFNAVEKVKYTEAVSHITTGKRRILVLARKSEMLFSNISQLATSINMRVNSRKTQMLLTHASKDSHI